MIFPRIERTDDGVAFADLAPPFVMMLLELPELLAPEQPDAVKERLYPDPTDDDEQNKEWDRLVRPELFALVASARDIVRQDLGSLRPEGTGAWRVAIPGAHVPAWISALNAARLTLGTVHEIEAEDDLHPDDDDDEKEVDEKRLAVVKIHVLGELQALLVLDYCPPPEEEEPEEEGS